MRAFINSLFYLCVCLVVTGIFLCLFRVTGCGLALVLGLSGVVVFFLSHMIKRIISGKIDIYTFLADIIIISVSIVLFIKYLHWSFFDYFSIIAIAAFIIFPFLYVFRHQHENIRVYTSKILMVYIIYALSIIPLLIEIDNGPNMLVPPRVYNKLYDVRSHPSGVKIECWSDSSKPYMDTAENLYKKSDIDGAITYFKKASAIEPYNYLFHFRLSELYLDNHSINEAVQELSEAIRLNPKFDVAYVNRGLLKYKIGDNEGALEDLNVATMLNKMDPIAYLDKSLALHSLKRIQEACLTIDTASMVNANNDAAIIREIAEERKRCDCGE